MVAIVNTHSFDDFVDDAADDVDTVGRQRLQLFLTVGAEVHHIAGRHVRERVQHRFGVQANLPVRSAVLAKCVSDRTVKRSQVKPQRTLGLFEAIHGECYLCEK